MTDDIESAVDDVEEASAEPSSEQRGLVEEYHRCLRQMREAADAIDAQCPCREAHATTCGHIGSDCVCAHYYHTHYVQYGECGWSCHAIAAGLRR